MSEPVLMYAWKGTDGTVAYDSLRTGPPEAVVHATGEEYGWIVPVYVVPKEDWEAQEGANDLAHQWFCEAMEILNAVVEGDDMDGDREQLIQDLMGRTGYEAGVEATPHPTPSPEGGETEPCQSQSPNSGLHCQRHMGHRGRHGVGMASWPQQEGEQVQQILHLSEDILEYCLSVGGTITGEHGVGIEKLHLMEKMFNPATIETFQQIKKTFDPQQRVNDGKLIPSDKIKIEIIKPLAPNVPGGAL